YRRHRRARLDARRRARRGADRGHRGDGRTVLHTIRQEHVLVRSADGGAAFQAAGHSGQEAVMIARLLDGVPARGLAVLAGLLAVLLAAPWVANDYVLTVLIIVLYSAYTGQAWNVMMGFSGPLSLRQPLYVGLGGPSGPWP